jgi:hypothetical protein
MWETALARDTWNPPVNPAAPQRKSSKQIVSKTTEILCYVNVNFTILLTQRLATSPIDS